MTFPQLSPQIVQRLAFVRFLYSQGVEQATKPEPLSATAVLSFHDAVELFLRLSAEALKVNLPNSVNFLDYWTKLQPAMPTGAQLPSKNAMDRMNKIRVAFKHHGTIPSATSVEQVRADVTTFLTDATQGVFGVDFAAIDMADLVTRTEVAQLLRDAHTHAVSGDVVMAMVGLRLAFETVLDRYAERGSWHSNSPFTFGPSLRSSTPREVSQFGRELEHLYSVAAEMQEALRVVALGIDYRRFAKFDLLAPRVHGTYSGSPHFDAAGPELKVTHEDYQFARNFVIEAALHGTQADSVIDWIDESGLGEGAYLPCTGRRSGNWTGPAGSRPEADEEVIQA